MRLSITGLVQHLLIPAVLFCFASGAAMAADLNLRVGIYENEPKVFTNPSGEPDGVFVEILQEVAAREGWQLQFVNCGWDECLRALQQGEIDLLPDVAYSEQRARVLDFHNELVLNSWSQIFAPRHSELVSLFQLQGKPIAVLRDSVQHEGFAEYALEFGVDVELIPVPDLEQAFAHTAAGDADAAISNHSYGLLHAPRYGLEPTPLVFSPARLYFATGAGRHTTVLSAIDHWLIEWRNDTHSVYYQILNRWEDSPEQPMVPAVFGWTLGGFITLMLLAFATAAWLRRVVALKTRDLKESEQKLATILDTVGAHIYIKDLDLRYVYVNRPVLDLFGRPREQIIGQRDNAFFDQATAQRVNADDRKVIESGHRVTTEETGTCIDGSESHTFLAVKIPLCDAGGQIYGICGVSTDITERKRNEEVIHQLAYFDTLTGLPNRSYLMQRLREVFTSQADLPVRALLYIDLDNFKDLNDVVGHKAGDDLLREVAWRLKKLVEHEDQLARLGGDEFAVLLESQTTDPEQAHQQAEQLAEQVRSCLKDMFQLGDFKHYGTSSIGVALVHETGEDAAEQLLQRAELAMYQAKLSGRNAIRFFSAAIQAAYAARVALESDLRTAVQENQFRLFYQPQVDAEQRLIGAEALLRWFHPQRGLVGPTEFIPVAESIGLVSRMGRWVLETACQQLARWRHDPAMAHLTLAVNVSAHQFRSADFVEDLLALLEQTGTPGERLKLELTETLLIEDLDEAAERINTLARHNIRVSLDDFGTGYSSLAYLQLLPLSQLKIDKSFVLDILTDPVAATIAASIVSLGESLDVEVIAEGVETAEQHAFLASLGCNFYQGYLFGHPDEIEALERLARESL